MPEIPHPARLVAEHPWIWGVAFGFVVAVAVLIVSAAEHGIRASNVLLALVLFIGFGLLGAIGGLFRRYTPGGPG